MGKQQPTDEPKGRARLQGLHSKLVADGYDVPEDYTLFESKLLEKPERLQGLHGQLVEDKYDVPADYTLFESKALEGLKKKEQPIGSTASEAGFGAPFQPSTPPLPGAVVQTSELEQPDELVAAGIPGDVPADVPTQPTGGAEQLPQPLGMSALGIGMSGQVDNPAEGLTPGRADQIDYMGTRTPQLTQQSADALAAVPDEEEDGFWSALGKSLRNSLDPRQVAGNLVDYAGDAVEMAGNAMGLTNGGAGGIAGVSLPLRQNKETDVVGSLMRGEAKAAALPISDNAKQSVLDQPTNPAAWGNLLGQGTGSIVQVGAATALGGPGAGIAAGAALSVSATKDVARENGISDKEATVAATVLAPVVGVLEEMGLGFITKNAAASKLLQREIIKRALAYGEGKLTKVAVVRAASELLPEVVKRTAKRAATGAAGEAGTEFLQGVAEGEAQVIADELRGNEEAPDGQGRYGTTQADVLKQASEGAIAGALLGGAAGGVGGAVQGAPQQEADMSMNPENIDTSTEPVQPIDTSAPAQPAATAVPTVRLKSGETILADFDENGQAIRAYTEQGQEFSLENPDVKAKIEEAGVVSLQQPTAQSDGTESQPTPELEGGGAASEVDLAEQAPLESEQSASIGGQPNQYDALPTGVPAELPGTGAQPNDTGAGELAPDDAGSQELVSEPVASTPEVLSTPSEQAPSTQQQQQAKTLTPQQQAQNDALDAFDNYKQLGARDLKGKPGAEARKQLAALAKKAGLDFTVGGDFRATLTKGGKRITRTSAVTATTPVQGHVPARQRSPEVRDAALTIAGRVAQGTGEFVGLGVTINGNRLSPRDAKAAAQDILAGRNTLRADELLNKLEAAQKEGFVEVSMGNGLATQKMRVPFEDYVGNAAPETARSAQPVELSDADWDALIAEDENVRQAIQEYGNEDGSLDAARLQEDAAGKGVPYLQFMFGINEDTATKLVALANERANPSPQESPVAGSEAASSPQPASPDSGSGSTANAEEVAPAAPTLRQQNEAAKADLTAALAKFKAARAKKSGVAYSSLAGAPFSQEEGEAIVDMVKALVKLGYTNSRIILAEMRGLGFDETDGTDPQVLPLIKQTLKDEGAFRAKILRPAQNDTPVAPTTGTTTKPRASMEKLDASPAFTDETKQAVKDTGLYDYTPRAQADAVAAVDAYMQRVSLAEAVALASGDAASLNGDVRTVLRQAVLKALNDQMRVLRDSGDPAQADALLEDVLSVARAYAGRGTDAGQEIAAYNPLHRFAPEAAVVQAVRETKQQADKLVANSDKKAPGVAKRARAVQKEAVDATLGSDAVAKAKAALTGDATATATKEPKSTGASNKFFTREGLAALRKQTGGMLFAAPISPVVIYEGAFYIEAGVRKFTDWSAKMVRSYGAAIRPRLAEVYESSKAEYIAKGGNPALVQSAADVDAALATQQAEMLATRIQQLAAENKPAGPKDPVQQLLDTLTAKVRENLPAQPGQPRVSPREAIVHALRNQAEYAAVWEQAKAQTTANIAAAASLTQSQKDALTDRLDTFYTETIGQAYATKQAATVVRTGLKELGAKLDEIVRRHATEQADTQTSLVSKLVAEAGLTQAEAQAYAAVVEKEFQRQLAAKRESILTRLAAKIGVPPVQRKGKTALDKLLETLNLSPVTDNRVRDLLREQLELPTLTTADIDRLRTLADAVQSAKGEIAKGRAVHELLLEQKRIAGLQPGQIIQALQYAGMLSGFITHYYNVVATGTNVVFEAALAVGNIAVRDPRMAGAPLIGLAKGLAVGTSAAYDIAATGVVPAKENNKFNAPNDLELVARTNAFASIRRYAGVMKYVGRMLVSEDAFFQGGLREMRAYEMAAAEAISQGKNRPTAEIWTDMHNKLYGANALLRDAQAQAAAEFPPLPNGSSQTAITLREAQYNVRVHELFTEGRDAVLAEEAREFGADKAFNGKMKGTIGALMQWVGRATEEGKIGTYMPLKIIIPFTGVVSNTANAFLDYSYYGYWRAIRGTEKVAGEKEKRQLTKEQRLKLATKATSGLMAGAAAMAFFTAQSLSGAGPDDPEKRKALLTSGWQPYSIKVGDTWMSYKFTPWYLILAGTAKIKEKEYYDGETYDNDPEGWLQQAGVITLYQLRATVEGVPLKSIQELLDGIMGSKYEATPGASIWKYLNRQAGYTAQNLALPVAGLFRQLSREMQQQLGQPKREAANAYQLFMNDIPGAQQGNIIYDWLGNPMPVDNDRIFSSAGTQDEATKQINAFIFDNKLTAPALNRNQTDLAVLKQVSVKQLSPEQKKEYFNLADKDRKGYLQRQMKHIGPMSDAEWAAFYKKRGELLKAAILSNLEDQKSTLKNRDGSYDVLPGLKTKAKENPRQAASQLSQLAKNAKEAALAAVLQDRVLNQGDYPPDEDDLPILAD